MARHLLDTQDHAGSTPALRTKRQSRAEADRQERLKESVLDFLKSVPCNVVYTQFGIAGKIGKFEGSLLRALRELEEEGLTRCGRPERRAAHYSETRTDFCRRDAPCHRAACVVAMVMEA